MASPQPFELDGLDHVVLLVRGMDRALRFYREVVGCTVDRELPQYGMAQLRAGRSLIDLVDIGSDEGAWGRPAVDSGRNMDHVCIATTGSIRGRCMHISRTASKSWKKASDTERAVTVIPSISTTHSATRSSSKAPAD